MFRCVKKKYLTTPCYHETNSHNPPVWEIQTHITPQQRIYVFTCVINNSNTCTIGCIIQDCQLSGTALEGETFSVKRENSRVGSRPALRPLVGFRGKTLIRRGCRCTVPSFKVRGIRWGRNHKNRRVFGWKVSFTQKVFCWRNSKQTMFCHKFGWKFVKSFVFFVQTYYFFIQNRKYGVVG